ncbi:MAG: DNA-3-methyladenine glycosylase [Nitrososphaerota archaeon]
MGLSAGLLSPLPRDFFEPHVSRVAKALLGRFLVRSSGGRTKVGMVVEVEAYRGFEDPASHAFRGRTRRNEVMFGPPGRAYIYRSYGLHLCLNVTAEPEGQPAAVLIRALEPVGGFEAQLRELPLEARLRLTSGPARLAKALELSYDMNGCDMTRQGELYLAWGLPVPERLIESSSRVGVMDPQRRPWRFYIKNNPFVSRASP